jgi:hypothetical protein
MRPAFPASDYYGGSVPPQGHQPTADLPATGLAGRRGGQPQGSSHVHHAPVDGGGAQLFPGSLATATPQTFTVASRPTNLCRPSESTIHWTVVRCCPAHIHQVGAGSDRLRGFDHWFLAYTFPSCLPSPGRLAVPTRPVVVRAAPALLGASRGRLPSASPACYDRPTVGPFIPPGHVALSWRADSSKKTSQADSARAPF